MMMMMMIAAISAIASILFFFAVLRAFLVSFCQSEFLWYFFLLSCQVPTAPQASENASCLSTSLIRGYTAGRNS